MTKNRISRRAPALPAVRQDRFQRAGEAYFAQEPNVCDAFTAAQMLLNECDFRVNPDKTVTLSEFEARRLHYIADLVHGHAKAALDDFNAAFPSIVAESQANG